MMTRCGSGDVTTADADPRLARATATPATRLVGTRGCPAQQVYSGALLDVRRDRVRLPDGGEAVREYTSCIRVPC